MFIRRLREIEDSAVAPFDHSVICEYRGLVCSVIMQCVAALETEAHEVCVYGPGSHLGSDQIDTQARDFLRPLADTVDSRSALDRFELILHLLRRPPLDKGREPYQSAVLVVRLRNELVHYKSRWGAEMESGKLYAALRSRRHSPPPFTSLNQNFFPHLCLGADCAAWSLSSVVDFLDSFYASLGVASPLNHYRPRLLP